MRGIILSGDFDKLVIQATAEDVRQFSVPGRAVHLSGAAAPGGVRFAGLCGQTLFAGDGTAVAVVTEVDIRLGDMDVTTFGHSKPQFIVGLPDVRIVARGVYWP